MAKTAAFGVVHLGVAFGVGYALTGSVATAGALTVVEPLCNMVAHYFFDRWWERRRASATTGPAAVQAPDESGSGGGSQAPAGTASRPPLMAMAG